MFNNFCLYYEYHHTQHCCHHGHHHYQVCFHHCNSSCLHCCHHSCLDKYHQHCHHVVATVNIFGGIAVTMVIITVNLSEMGEWMSVVGCSQRSRASGSFSSVKLLITKKQLVQIYIGLKIRLFCWKLIQFENQYKRPKSLSWPKCTT